MKKLKIKKIIIKNLSFRCFLIGTRFFHNFTTLTLNQCAAWLWSSYLDTWFDFRRNQKTLCVVTITMICLNLASLWKFQYFWRPIYNSLEYLWWNVYCENRKSLNIITKSFIIGACFGCKYASAFWRLFKRFISLKYFTS